MRPRMARGMLRCVPPFSSRCMMICKDPAMGRSVPARPYRGVRNGTVRWGLRRDVGRQGDRMNEPTLPRMGGKAVGWRAREGRVTRLRQPEGPRELSVVPAQEKGMTELLPVYTESAG